MHHERIRIRAAAVASTILVQRSKRDQEIWKIIIVPEGPFHLDDPSNLRRPLIVAEAPCPACRKHQVIARDRLMPNTVITSGKQCRLNLFPGAAKMLAATVGTEAARERPVRRHFLPVE